MDFLVDPPAGCDEDSLRRHDWHAEQLQRLGVADVVAEIFADAVEWHVSETEGRQANLTKGTRAIPGRCHYRAGDGMLNRVALDRGETSADVVI
ncbi:MAG: hypothetical protein ACXVRV_11625, partial [Gaiellaceae bacterium]